MPSTFSRRANFFAKLKRDARHARQSAETSALDFKKLERAGVSIRRAQPSEITPVRDFIETNFSVAWADEISIGFANKPVTGYIATRAGRVIGFAGYECTRKAFFGPTGVVESERGRRHWEGSAGNVAVGVAGIGICLWNHRRRRADGVLSRSSRRDRDPGERAGNLYGFIEVALS